ETLAGFTKAVVYNVEGTATEVADALGGTAETQAGINDAVDVSATGTADVSQAEVIADANNSGGTTYDVADSLTSVLGGAASGALADTAAEKNGLTGAASITINDITAGNETVTFNNLESDLAATTIDFTDDDLATLTAGEVTTITGAGLALTDADAITVTGVTAANATTVAGVLAGDNDTVEFVGGAVELAQADFLTVAGAASLTAADAITVTGVTAANATAVAGVLAGDNDTVEFDGGAVELAQADFLTVAGAASLTDTDVITVTGVTQAEFEAVTDELVGNDDIVDLGEAITLAPADFIDAFDTKGISATTGDEITVDMASFAATAGAIDIAGTAANDTFDYAGTETNKGVTGFGGNGSTDTIDLIDANAATTLTEADGSNNFAMADNAVFFLNIGSSGDVELSGQVANALNTAFSDDVDMTNSFVVIADDDSSAIYAVSNTSGTGIDDTDGDLKLIGTIDSVLMAGNIAVDTVA
ncbi:hypothetical protein, partial [Vreelandella gomseomensis]